MFFLLLFLLPFKSTSRCCPLRNPRIKTPPITCGHRTRQSTWCCVQSSWCGWERRTWPEKKEEDKSQEGSIVAWRKWEKRYKETISDSKVDILESALAPVCCSCSWPNIILGSTSSKNRFVWLIHFLFFSKLKEKENETFRLNPAHPHQYLSGWSRWYPAHLCERENKCPLTTNRFHSSKKGTGKRERKRRSDFQLLYNPTLFLKARFLPLERSIKRNSTSFSGIIEVKPFQSNAISVSFSAGLVVSELLVKLLTDMMDDCWLVHRSGLRFSLMNSRHRRDLTGQHLRY